MAFAQSLRHHWDVVVESWRAETDKIAGPTRREHELDFLPAALEVLETPASASLRRLAWAIMALTVIALAWGFIGKLEVVAVASGKVITKLRTQVIQPLETAAVRAIHVHEGKAVSKGEVLIELNPTGAEADRARLEHEVATATADTARLTALLADNPARAFAPPADLPPDLVALQRRLLDGQWQEYQAKLKALDTDAGKRQAEAATIEAEIKRLDRILPGVSERLEGRRDLANRQITARHDMLKQEQEFLELSGQREVHRRKLDESRAALELVRNQRRQAEAEFRRDQLNKLAEARQKRVSAVQELIKAAERSRVQTIIAPVDGVVQQLAVHTEGGVVTPAQQLLVIVPKDSQLEIEASVQNRDIAFIREGQRAVIKIESLPFTRFGTLDGTVGTVSGDAVNDETQGLVFPVRVIADRSVLSAYGRDFPLAPGMATTVEIITRQRRVIEYLLDPVTQHLQESWREM